LVRGQPQPQRVDRIAARLKSDAWQAYVIKEGSKGPIVAEVTVQVVPVDFRRISSVSLTSV